MIYIRWVEKRGDEELTEVFEDSNLAVKLYDELLEREVYSLTLNQPHDDYVPMKPSEKIKALGFKSLEEAAELSGETRLNLTRWSESYPRRFELILKGLMFERMNEQINTAFYEIRD
tara:strand:+ start:513 stop:863 length:351 start_codon:yes stop_codon:yes gene_type:complete